jgi:hypothetical protein
MHTSRRRTRYKDPLASPEAVRDILGQLQRQCREEIPISDRLALKMLESVRHYERHPNVNESRGRPRRWPRKNVTIVAERLKKILERKTDGRVSLSSFISFYLPILRYPTDVASALAEGEINIREATYLARLMPRRLNCSARQARQMRAEVLKSHSLTKGSQSSLRYRVKAMLGETLEREKQKLGRTGMQKADELLKLNPYDARHLFYEEIQQLIEIMRHVDPEDLKEKTLSRFLLQMDKLMSILRGVKRVRTSN